MPSVSLSVFRSIAGQVLFRPTILRIIQPSSIADFVSSRDDHVTIFLLVLMCHPKAMSPRILLFLYYTNTIRYFLRSDINTLLPFSEPLRSDFVLVPLHKSGAGQEIFVLQKEVRVFFPQIFGHGFEDVFAVRQPDYPLIGTVPDVLEGNVTFADAGGVNNSRFAAALQHGHCLPARFFTLCTNN